MANILLIEPDRLLAETYAQAILSAGHQVAVAPGAQSAILVADRFEPDLVVVELQLVEHSGIEFLYEFRSYTDWQAVPIIIHSHVPPREFNGSSQLLRDELGVRDYLYKPQTSLAQFIKAINGQLVAA
jgi:DNA-binding response OmpR family regulator